MNGPLDKLSLSFRINPRCVSSLSINFSQLFGVALVELVFAHELIYHISLGKLLILAPEVRFSRLVLVLRDLVQDAQVCNDVIRLELLPDLKEQLLLGIRQIGVFLNVAIACIVLTVLVQ